MDELSKVFESVADYFGLLAEPARLRILHALCEDELAVNEIVERSGLTQANTSRHLNMLYRAQIVDRRREGSQVFYRITDPNFKDMCRTVCITIAARSDMDQPRRASFRRLEKDLDGTTL
jgi:DNA-binding transcriptional ArsR family regulator